MDRASVIDDYGIGWDEGDQKRIPGSWVVSEGKRGISVTKGSGRGRLVA